MSKIREVIKINSGYTSYVDLNQEFFYYNEEQNLGRMERYMPIKAHRLAFEKITNALNPKDRRCYFLSGSYGTGKSHLCLMLGNYFAKQSNSLEMETFFKNYEISQKEVLLKIGETLDEKPASSFIASRKEGKFLVAICRFGLNLEFEGVVLRAIEEALEKHGAVIEMDTHFKEADRRLDEWEKQKTEKPFFKNFDAELKQKHPDWTFANLKNRLRKGDEAAFNTFKQVFKVVTDNDFSFSKDNLPDILTDILTHDSFKKNYKGIVIIYDEFGDALDENRVILSRFQEFAQYCANSGMKGLPVIFLGTGHKTFSKHGHVSEAVYFSKLADRVTEIQLQTEGMEDIIAAIVQQKKDTASWKNEVEPNSDIFAQFPVECKRLGIFNWLPAPKLKNNIIRNIYPMHPLATYALLQMASALGSDNRSVFKFFSPEFEVDANTWKNIQKHSYPWFIENNEIIQNDRLKLLTSDILFDYFQDSITEGRRTILDRIRTSIANYEATLRSLKSYVIANKEKGIFDEVDEKVYQIMKAILVNEIVSNEKYPIINVKENIQFALNAVTDGEKQEIENRVDFLCKKAILFKNDKQVYEFRRSDIQDIGQMVTGFKQDPENKPENIKGKFFEYMPLEKDELFLEAKDYNTTYNEDKRLAVRFSTPPKLEQKIKETGKDINIFEKLELDRKNIPYGKDSYEGTAIFVFCESQEDVDQAKRLCAADHIERVVVAIPKKGMDVKDYILTLMAIESIQTSKQAESFGAHENSQLLEMRKGAELQLRKVKESYFDNKQMTWFSNKGISLPVNEANRYDAANKMMSRLFDGKRNMFSHTDFNKVNIKNTGTTHRIMTEAGDLLLDLTQDVKIDWSHPDNRGDKKYFRRCFVDNQVLRSVHKKGDMRYFEVERAISKFDKVLPSYSRMLKDIEALEGKGSKLCKQFFEPYFEEFGQGEIAIALMVLLARRFYGDSLRFKREKDALTDIHFDKTGRVIDLISGKEPNAVLFYKGISKEDTEFFNSIFQVFMESGIEAGKKYGVNDAYKSIVTWWNGLPVIARSEQFYNKELKPFVETLNSADTKDPFGFIKYDLLTLFGLSEDEKVSKDKLVEIKKSLGAFKNAASEILNDKEQDLLEKVAGVFDVKTTLPIDIQDAVKNWYDNLGGFQKDTYGKFHTNESKVIISRIKQMLDIKTLIFNDFPEAFGFGPLSTWGTDKIEDYIDKLHKGKALIDNSKPPVGDVVVLNDKSDEVSGNTIPYRGEYDFHFSVKEDAAIYYTDDGSDPTDTKSERKRFQKDETLKITKGNRTIRVVACDNKGNYGNIRRILFVDATKKHLITPSGIIFPDIDTPVTFIFPVDKKSAQISIDSLFKEIFKAKIVTVEDLEEIASKIIEEIKS